VSSRTVQGCAVVVGVLLGFVVTEARADAQAVDLPPAKEAVAPAAPVLPGEVVAAMQEGHYGEAVSALVRLKADAKTKEAEKPYYALIQGIAERLDGKVADARDTLKGAIEAAPKGPWAAKLRFELAALELSAGRFSEAEQLARAEAETLLAGDRKDRLAEVYHAFARRLLKPDEPVQKPDPEGAYALLVQGRSLAKSDTLRARLLFAMAHASQAAGNHPRAIQDFENYLKEYPKGADRAQARYGLAESQMTTGQVLAARLTWSDLARDLEKLDTKDGAELRGRSLYWIAKTYGIPAPQNDTNMNLGVAALNRLLAAYPAHPLAVRAAYEIGASYLARGKSQEASEVLTAFIRGEAYRAEADEAKREQASLLMTATFQIGQILQGQEKFSAAIDAFKGYLAKFPNGPQSADAQRAILDTQLMIADEHYRREK